MQMSNELSNGCRMGQHVTCGVSGEAFADKPAWLCGCACHTDGRYAEARATLDARFHIAGVRGGHAVSCPRSQDVGATCAMLSGCLQNGSN